MTLSSCTNELSPTNEKDALLNRQFPFGNDLSKDFKNKKAEKHCILFSQHKYVTSPKGQAVNYAIE